MCSGDFSAHASCPRHELSLLRPGFQTERFLNFSSEAARAPLCTSVTTSLQGLEFVGLLPGVFKECPSAFTSLLLWEPRIRVPHWE